MRGGIVLFIIIYIDLFGGGCFLFFFIGFCRVYIGLEVLVLRKGMFLLGGRVRVLLNFKL